jgi:hypothetical protein
MLDPLFHLTGIGGVDIVIDTIIVGGFWAGVIYALVVHPRNQYDRGYTAGMHKGYVNAKEGKDPLDIL